LPGVGLLIAKTLAPVVPMRVFGGFDAWPIGERIHLFRRITIMVGEPIYFSEADLSPREGLYARLSQRIMDAIAALHLE
jgi:1-acyl-sn-glycerol-3-phosphate acyltransferase